MPNVFGQEERLVEWVMRSNESLIRERRCLGESIAENGRFGFGTGFSGSGTPMGPNHTVPTGRIPF
jgi:hypothetical protein